MAKHVEEFRCKAPGTAELFGIVLVLAVGFAALSAFLFSIGITTLAYIAGSLAMAGFGLSVAFRPQPYVFIARPDGLEIRIPKIRKKVAWSEISNVQAYAVTTYDVDGTQVITRYLTEVTLADGVKFVIEQWQGHQQVLGCIVLRRFDPQAFWDMRTEAIPWLL